MARQHIKDNMGVVVKVRDNKVFFNHSKDIDCKKIIEWFGGKKYNKLILTRRSDDLQIIENETQTIPHENVVKQLKDFFKNKLYLFIQDPWPNPLKEFDMDDKTFVLRFTYDEGCEMDRTWRDWNTQDGYYMLTNTEVVPL